MNQNFTSWLRQHKEEIEARWSAVLRDTPTYACLSADKDSRWHPLVKVLMADEYEDLVEQTRQWAAHEMQERQITPSALLSVAAGLTDTIQDMLSEARELDQAADRLNNLTVALAQYFADEAERLAGEKSRLESLYEITRELTSSLDLPHMLHRTLDEVMTAISAEMGAIFLANHAADQATPEVKINWNGEEIPLAMLPSAWQLGQKDKPLILNDRQKEQPEAWVEILTDPSIRSLMAAPLIANGEFRGLLTAASPRPDAFSPNHIRLFHTVLSHIATAIANAEVYQFISEQSQELGQMLRLQQEESIRRQAILTSIADGVVVNDAEGRVILVNPAAELILDTSSEQLIGRDFHVLFSVFGAQSRTKASEAMQMLLNSSASEVSKPFKTVMEIDERIVHAHLSPVRTRDGSFLGVVATLRDVTKEVEADRAKSEFISTVSHELRTPMTAIKGYTDLLHGEVVGPINSDQKRFLSIIKNNTDRLTALINDLLDISRVETGRVRFEPQAVQIGDVIADVVSALAGQAEVKNQSLTYEIVGGLPEIMGDRDRLNQVLTNLIGNAIHYTPHGGMIEVRAYHVENAVRVDVRDTGIGIAPDDMGRIFERFYRADHPLVQETSGTGLGLSIVRMFVEMHGGRVWVESRRNKGSTFTFILPLPVQDGEEEVRRVAPRLMARVRTILVVDDDRDISNLVKVQLEQSGYRVRILGSGKAVPAWAEENLPDLIILDLILPDTDGIEVIRALKKNTITADIPVIVLTVVPDDGSAWDEGLTDYLIKPVDNRELLYRVEKALTWQGRVLIVEDDADTVGLLAAAMRQIGFTPLVAVGGYEALVVARRYRPDLILLDLRMPGMDGYEALTHLKRDAVTQAIPIVAISAHVTDVMQERKRLIALGATSFLPKPFSIEELLDEVETALQPVSSGLASF
jgi:PAS domain S-box-containing protein